MGPKPKKAPKAYPKSRVNTAAKETVQLRKSPRLARSEDSDQSDRLLNATLSSYSGSTEIIPPTAEASSPTPVLHLPINDPPPLVRQDNLNGDQMPTTSPQGGSPGGNSNGNNSEMESLTAQIQQLEAEVRTQPVGMSYRGEVTAPNQVAMPSTSHESRGPRAPNRSKRRRELSSSSSSSDDDDAEDDNAETSLQ